MARLLALALSLLFTFGQSQTLNSTSCDVQCLAIARNGSAWELSQHANPQDEFYSIPPNFAHGKPGTVLRLEKHTDLANYTVPTGISMSRVIYTSTNLRGKKVPASAYILWPYAPLATETDSKFPIAAWAHGTSGLFPACGPSNYRALQYHFQAPFALALEGFAVVAPDYAGLGVTDGETVHEYFAAPAQANDLANAIIAARNAFTELDPEGPFVALGHSQGGGIAWSFAERQARDPVPGYRGTVSFAAPTRIIDWFTQAAENPDLPWAKAVLGLQPLAQAGITAVYPRFNYSGMLPDVYDRWNNVLKPLQGCLPTFYQLFSGIPLAEPDWYKTPLVRKWAEEVAVNGKAFKGPLLVVAGVNDSIVPLSVIEDAVDDTCDFMTENNLKEQLEFLSYEDMDHFPVIQANRMDWMGRIKEWIAGGETYESGCKRSRKTGFNTEYMQQVASPDWLVTWASPLESWKYTL